MIKFLQETTLTIVEGFDEATETITDQQEETFQLCELVDADIVSEKIDSPYVDLQFGDGGGVAFHVKRTWFEVVPDERLTKLKQSV